MTTTMLGTTRDPVPACTRTLLGKTTMKVVPGLYQYMDLPDVVSMTAPGGLMVIHGIKDQLFSPDGVQAAFDKIAAVYKKAGVPERFQGVTYDGPHEFNVQMQELAFAWLDRWLKP